MDLRRLCNVAYSYLSRGLEGKDLQLLDNVLEGKAQPSGAASHVPAVAPRPDLAGMRALQAAMSMPQKA